MIPEFPQFKSLELEDRGEIEKITKKYPPYSDFNFVSMWSWDTKGEMRISRLNSNLVVRFTDYLTGEPFYSFLGDIDVNNTAQTLMEFAQKEGLKPTLRLLPEDSARGIDLSRFTLEEDRDQFDYVYDISKVHTHEGSHHKSHRQAVRFFEKNNTYEYWQLDLSDPENQKKLIDLVHLWIKNKKEKAVASANYHESDDSSNEYIALQRLFSAPKQMLDTLICFSVFVDGTLNGFMVDEKVSDEYCISHFGKTDLRHKGNLQLLMQKSTQTFFGLGVKYYNDEQDLGLKSLRSAKSSYKLAHFLKKYTLTLH